MEFVQQPSGRSTSRISPFAASVLIHGVCLAWVVFGPRVVAVPAVTRASLEKDYKIVWYPRTKIPEIAPTRDTSPKSIPRPLPLKDRTVLSTNDNRVRKQIILQPDSKLQLTTEIPVPNFAEFRAPALAPPPKPQPKTFVPPAPSSPAAPTPAVTMLASAPEVANPRLPVPMSSAPEMPRLRKPPPRNFVPATATPGASGEGTRVTLQEPLPLQAAEGRSDVALNALVVGLDSLDRLKTPLPPGSLPGQVSASKDEVVGPTGSGSGKQAVTVPNVIVREGKADSGSPFPEQPKSTPAERAKAAARSSVSAPLRAAPRIAPVETSFRDRTLYTCLLELPATSPGIEPLVLWFAESEVNRSALLIRAPVLIRAGLPEASPANLQGKDRAYVKLSINRDGLVRSLILIDSSDKNFSAAVLAALAQWEFVPATKNGQPVEIDAIVELPIRSNVRLSGN